MAKFGVIIAAAGSSSRLGGTEKKQFEDIAGRAVFLRAIEPFQDRPDVGAIVLAVAPEDLERVKTRWGNHLGFHGVKLIAGGSERVETVAAAFELIPADCDHVAIHDAARPLLAAELIDQVFHEATMSGAAILALPLTATLKRVAESEAAPALPGFPPGKHRQITATVPRQGLWLAQTPQVFRKTIFAEALAKWKASLTQTGGAGEGSVGSRGSQSSQGSQGSEGSQAFAPITDDAQLVEAVGHPVSVIMGRPDNFKITTAADLEMARQIARSRPAIPPRKGWVGPPII